MDVIDYSTMLIWVVISALWLKLNFGAGLIIGAATGIIIMKTIQLDVLRKSKEVRP